MTVTIAGRYLSLLKKALLDELYLENEARIAYLIGHALDNSFPALNTVIHDFVSIQKSPAYSSLKQFRETGMWIARYRPDNQGQLQEILPARNFSFTAHTMIGRARMDNLQFCMESILQDNIPGDFIETGVWKGGATIFMRGFLAAHDETTRTVWVADSFEGLPVSTHTLDRPFDLSATAFPYLAVSLEEVQELFARYELLDDQVRFLKGWFKDSLPSAPIERLALLRLDGDLYESTMDALTALYRKVSVGGFVIVDDYGALPQCRQAIEDFRQAQAITEPLVRVDECAVYWQKTARN